MSKSRIVNRMQGRNPPTPTNPRPADNTAPSAPGTPVVGNITADSATITFAASASSDVVGYAAYLDGGDLPAALSEGNAAAITLRGLLPGSHSAVVKAFDSAENLSPASASVTIEIDSSIIGKISQTAAPIQSARPLLIYAQTTATPARFNVDDMQTGTIVISGLAGETVQLKPVYADLADVGAGTGIYVRKADGTLVQATALGNGTYNIEKLSCSYIDVVKSAAVQSLTLQGELRGDHFNTEPFKSKLSAVTTTAVTRLGTAGFASALLTISGLVAETIKLAPVFADGQSPAGGGILIKNMAGVISEATTLGNGVYQIETFGCPFVDVVKSAGVNPVSLRFEAL